MSHPATSPAPAAGTAEITGEDLFAMGMDNVGPCELIDGRIVPVSPAGGRHAKIESDIGRALGNFAAQQHTGTVLVGDVGIYTRRNPDRVRGADVVFISHARLPAGLPAGYLTTAPDLVVEVLSPNDTWRDMRAKLDEYFAIGVLRVWVVDPAQRAVWDCRAPDQCQRCGDADVLRGDGALAGFTLPLADLFGA